MRTIGQTVKAGHTILDLTPMTMKTRASHARAYTQRTTGTGAAFKDVDTAGRTVTGYMSVFGNKDSHGDVIVSGAYAKTIAERGPESAKSRIVYLRNHMTDAVLGKFTVLKEDDYGLYFEAKVSDTALGRDTLTLIRDGVLKENSIGYTTIQEKYDAEAKVNYLTEIKLWEGSTVTWASNELAAVTGTKSAVELAAEYADELSRIKSVLRSETISDETGYLLDLWVKQMQAKAEELAKHLTDAAASQKAVEVASSAPDQGISEGTLNLITLGIQSHAKGAAVDVRSLIHMLNGEIQ